MFRLKPTTAEATTTIRLAVPQSLHDQLTAAAAEANIEVQEAARQAISYAFSRVNKALSSRTLKQKAALTAPEGNEKADISDANPDSQPETSER